MTAFSRWEKELPKLIGDERYKAMASMKDRKAAFEEYCRDTGVQRQRAKAGSQAGAGSLEEARAGFRTLMAEASARLASGGGPRTHVHPRASHAAEGPDLYWNLISATCIRIRSLAQTLASLPWSA